MRKEQGMSTQPLNADVEHGSEERERESGKCRSLSTTTWLAIGVVALILLGVLIAVVTKTASPEPVPPPPPRGANFTFNDVFNSSLAPGTAGVNWIANGEYGYWECGSLLKYNLYTGLALTVAAYDDLCSPSSPLPCTSLQSSVGSEHHHAVGSDTLRHRRARKKNGQHSHGHSHSDHITLSGPPGAPQNQACNHTLVLPYVVSPSQQHVLVWVDVEPLYRWSFFATYYVFNTASKTFTLIGNPGSQLQYATFVPTADGENVAFVQNNNIFITSLADGTTTQVTSDGVVNSVLNGLCDWAYEEEVYSHTHAMWWAADGSALAFLKFTEERVPTYSFPRYALPYNNEYVYKYPKPGSNNSIIELGVYVPQTGNTTWIKIPDGVDMEYIVEVGWAGHTLLFKTMPRLQNQFTLWRVSVEAGVIGVVAPLTQEESDQYIEIHHVLTYIPNHNVVLDLMHNDGFEHLAAFSPDNAMAPIQFLTQGQWMVDAVVGYNAATSLLVFTSTQRSSIERGLYAVNVSAALQSKAPVAPQPIICRQNSTAPLDPYFWDDASMDPGGEYFVLNTQAAPIPVTLLCQLTGTGAGAHSLRVLRNNSNVVNTLATFAIPSRKFVNFNGSKASLRGEFIFPASFTDDCSRNHPVLIQVYGGPGAQQVNTKFYYGSGGPGWHTHLGSTYDFIIFIMDPIGTGGLGEAYQKNSTYLHLGLNEAVDVINGVNYLKSQCFVDPDRIALWGWSYGGYLSGMVASHGEESGLRAIIAIAPVTDWRLYDSIYTERYMGIPSVQGNLQGYLNSSLIERASGFSRTNPRLLTVHGTADDNVHFQNSALLVDQLTTLRIPFNSFYYPNQAHSLRGPNGETNKHLYAMLSQFLLDTFQLPYTRTLYWGG